MIRPLEGRSIVVTRARSQAADLVDGLAALGAEVLEFPTIRIAEPESWEAADAAVRALGSYDWVLFTSANAVDAFVGRMGALGVDPALLGSSRLAAVGPSTAARLRAHGLSADLVPAEHVAEGLLDSLIAAGVGPGSRLLLPRALEARDLLPESLRERGATLEVVPVYRTVPGDGDPSVTERLRQGGVDVVTFTSSSTASNFVRLASDAIGATDRPRFLAASIGPVTSDTLRSLGVPVAIEASPSTVPALIEAIAAHYASAGA